ncbi:hypothetical protein JQ574_26220 [Bradyrhizobium sp. AUGA SZCCT0158]|uniref:hypothetical protein n=1 Tax=Bradyrhizobium sp. AUGA SZCCT0158 TaxID=2807661 RepID=UPI001BA62572|nr:hypothetical protein [Bradyrhizobium sp. AUGA SZCCT0158]MBR1199499.1 hypothetical protein [Bradyrhizobium sp. AUGA SZCCT0158]
MLGHAEINQRFLELDRHPVLLREAFDGWLAWPIVKERIWLLCFEVNSQPSPADSIRRLRLGISQIVRGLAVPIEADLALFYEPREVTPIPGITLHPHLGEIDHLKPGRRILHYRYDWGTTRDRSAGPGLFDNYGIGAVTAAGASVVSRAPAIRRLAEGLSGAIAALIPELPRQVVALTVSNQLARFRIQFGLIRLLLKRWKVRSIVVLDASAKIPEIAAAKSLGLPVTEVQHGMFSAKEPHYSWSAVHRALPLKLPLPDRMVVFGPLWGDQLRRAGYWCGDEIIEAPSPILDKYRHLATRQTSAAADSPLRLVFPTQPYVQAAAIQFLNGILERQKNSGSDTFRLRIKIHPLERTQRSEYLVLADKYPESCSIAADDSEAFDEMLKADCVIGYTSLMLLEAIGLGIPVVGLRGGAAAEGFCATFEMPELADIIPEVSSAEALLSLISMWRNSTGYVEQRALVARAMTRVYTIDGPKVEDIIGHA